MRPFALAVLIIAAAVHCAPAQIAFIDDPDPTAGTGNTHPWGQTNGFTTLHVYHASQLTAAGIAPGSLLLDVAVVPSSGSSGTYNAPQARFTVGHLAVPAIVPGMWESNIANPVVIHDLASGPFTFPWTISTWCPLPGVASAGFIWDGLTDICFYYTSSPGTTGTFTARRTAANPRHSVTVFGATTEAPTSVAAFAMKARLTFGSAAPAYQVNQSAATFIVGGVAGSAVIPATVVAQVGATVNVSFQSSNLGFGWDLGLTIPGQLLPYGSGGILLPGSGQFVNLDVGSPNLVFLNNFAFPPFGGNFVVPVTGTGPATVAAQMVVLDLASAEGFALSGPARLVIQ